MYYIITRKDTRGNWHEEGRFTDETDAVLTARQIEQAFPYDIVQIIEDVPQS